MGAMFRFLLTDDIRAELATWPWALVLLCVLPVLLAATALVGTAHPGGA